MFWPLLFLLLVSVVTSVFFAAPVMLTVDGFSHLNTGVLISRLFANDPAIQQHFAFNSPLTPNWLSGLSLALLSRILPAEAAVRLFAAAVACAFYLALYFCIRSDRHTARDRTRILIVLLPFALNASVTYGFYGFLISASLSLLTLGLVLRDGLRMTLGRRVLIMFALLVAYFAHPLPVALSLFFPCSLAAAEIILAPRDDRRAGATIRKLFQQVWPWAVPALLAVWYAWRLNAGGSEFSYSPSFIVYSRLLYLSGSGLTPISPTPTMVALFTLLVGMLLAAAIRGSDTRSADERRRATALVVLCATMLGVFLIAPITVGDGGLIEMRVLLFTLIALLLLALMPGVMQARMLSASAVIAAIIVAGFSMEYWLISTRLAPAVAELESAMARVPAQSRVVIMGYWLTPGCRRWALDARSYAEEHWAMGPAVKSNLIVLNDYQTATRHFPVRLKSGNAATIAHRISLDVPKSVNTWTTFLSQPQPDVEYVVTWGVPSGVANCDERIAEPLENELRSHYDRMFALDDSSRAVVWRRR